MDFDEFLHFMLLAAKMERTQELLPFFPSPSALFVGKKNSMIWMGPQICISHFFGWISYKFHAHIFPFLSIPSPSLPSPPTSLSLFLTTLIFGRRPLPSHENPHIYFHNFPKLTSLSSCLFSTLAVARSKSSCVT